MTTLLIIQLVGGFIYLLAGGDLLVRGAIALARHFRISQMIVALTIVAFGTSLPELMVAAKSALAGYPGLVLGNVVGSNIANVLLVGGAAAIVFPLASNGGRQERRDATIMLAVTIGFVLLCASGNIGITDGVILFIGLAAITFIAARDAARDSKMADDTPLEWVLGMPDKLRTITLFIIAGAIGLPLGASLVVDASVEIATQLGVSDVVIGLTILAFATSLPELATTGVAAFRKNTDVAVGTIVGSNIFNILAVMAVGAVVSPVPLPINDGFFKFDFPVMLGSTLLLAIFVWLPKNIGRTSGVLFLTLYLVYIAAIALRQGSFT